MGNITESQRYTLSSMLREGYSRNEIAFVIGKDKSVISRELSRNSEKRNEVYKHELAQRKCAERHLQKPQKKYFILEVEVHAKAGLDRKYSPEQIVGIANKEEASCVSTERIYQYIWLNKKQGGKLFDHLRSSGKRYRKRGAVKDRRGIITGRIDISKRLEEVELRERIGDLETDTITGRDHQGPMVTIKDRAPGFVKMKKLNSKDAVQLAAQTINLMTEWKPHLKTITADHGKEFAAHQTISQALKIDFYFARPYHSWERGSNENLNGLIRQYIPKKVTLKPLQMNMLLT